MSNEGFTISIHVPDGDPESYRIISRADRPAQGIYFPVSVITSNATTDYRIKCHHVPYNLFSRSFSN
jgi:hypothetical protein